MYTNSPQDPRNPLPNFSTPFTPWAVDLFNIRPRDGLRLRLHYRYDQGYREGGDHWDRDNNQDLYDGIRTISIIRRFLLNNAQGLRNEYTGIRVMIWVYRWNHRGLGGRRNLEVVIESDDRYWGQRDGILSRLRTPTFGVQGEPRQPQFIYMATEHPPPYVTPMPPPPPPPPPVPERVDGDDEEDEANPCILGP